jgi:hypothetical protein
MRFVLVVLATVVLASEPTVAAEKATADLGETGRRAPQRLSGRRLP